MFFFFQAEDGIRDYDVTGVQTCALPICGLMSGMATVARALKPDIEMVGVQAELYPSMYSEIGRASCRERV